MARSVLAARNCKSVAAIYVSTDDRAIMTEAQYYGASVIERPADLSGDEASSEIGWLHALSAIRSDYPKVEKLVFLQCTSPFTTSKDIEECLDAMERGGAACAISVLPDHSFLWTVVPGGWGKGVNHDELLQRKRRQDIPPTYRESGAIYCVRVKDFESKKSRFCGPVALHVVNHPPVEIDTLADLELCDIIAKYLNESEPASGMIATDIKALVMDFDGVHTDDTVSVDENGVESVRVSRRDGLGLEQLRQDGRWRLLILSKEKNKVVTQRAAKLSIECIQASDDKVKTLKKWMDQNNLSWSEIFFVGNDVNDLEAIKLSGYSAAPQDAHPHILKSVDWIIPKNGGSGVLRYIADSLLRVPD